ncbi:hypothetical protein [Chryseobacterium wanjuense]
MDGSTFSVDAANNRVGVGTVSPKNLLDLGSAAGSSATDAAGKNWPFIMTEQGMTSTD